MTFTLTIAIGASGGGTTRPSPGSYSYPPGTVISVGAFPSQGYAFSHWSGDVTGTSSVINVTLDRHKRIVANFVPISTTPPVMPVTQVQTPPQGIGKLVGKVDSKGMATEAIMLSSEDGTVHIAISQGTTLLNASGDPLDDITFDPLGTSLSPPEGRSIILAVDLGPDGAVFDPPITISMTYDPKSLPEGASESDLVLMYYDPAGGRWMEVDNMVRDPTTHTITGTISHFTVYAILAGVQASPPSSPVSPPIPAMESAQKPAPEGAPPQEAPAVDAGDKGSPSRVPLISGIAVAGVVALAGMVLWVSLRQRRRSSSSDGK